ncbi:hypothetical protein C0J52_02351 [Blattella germanica]|nr:hypothetical protein C0J52_02351 [Blattella germanica]
MSEGAGLSQDVSQRHLIRSRERTVISKVIECCVAESTAGSLLASLSCPNKRASIYTGASLSTIGRIKRQRLDMPKGILPSPIKKNKPSKKKAEIDGFDRAVIRRTMEDFYINQKIVPSVRKLLIAVKEKIDFPWQKDVLRNTLRDMGFVWKRSVSKRKVLVERREIVDWRCRYLIKMRQYRSEGKPVFFLDETEKVFKIDQLFNAHGHSVLRLPPYMCELNAIELAWAKLKNFVRSKNVGGDINMTRLREIVLEGLNQITTEDWMGYCSHVQKIEEEHWERDGIVENALESIIIDLDTSDEESDDEEEEKDVGVPSC